MYNKSIAGSLWSQCKEAKLFSIFFLSFSSGLPFLLILSTLSVWLAESGINKTQIGIFALVTVPYTLKFLLAPLVNYLKLPILTKLLGQRRSWMLFSQIALVFCLICLGKVDPTKSILQVGISAFAVGLFSAIQDLVVEAYRIESVEKHTLSLGASASVLGYRIGMLCSGAGAMHLASYYNWPIAYSIMALLVFIGILTTLLCREPKVFNEALAESTASTADKDLSTKQNLLKIIVVEPLLSFYQNRAWWIIIPFIIFFKFSDTILNAMNMPFLLEAGFNKIEIAHVSKSFGIIMMIIGGLAGGTLLLYHNLQRIFFLTVMLQVISSLLFILQSFIGHNLAMLFITMGLENFACGLGQVVLITYFSKLCLHPHTALHYSLLSSFSSLIRINFSVLSGLLADLVSWPYFYLISSLSCIPTLLMLFIYVEHFAKVDSCNDINMQTKGVIYNKIINYALWKKLTIQYFKRSNLGDNK